MINILCIFLICLSGCSHKETSFQSISQEDAVRMMEEEEDYIVADVRTFEEYSEGHIPEAVNIPLESIGEERPEQLPDVNQLILIYCRSGVRSKKAALKLAELGYQRVYEFGGINDWKGEIVNK